MGENHAEQITGYLKQMMDSDLADAFLIVSRGDVYIQFMRGDDDAVYCEAVSNAYLPKQRQLSAAQMRQLAEWGFAQGDSDNFSATLPMAGPASAAEIARRADQILREVYGVSPDDQLEFEQNT